MKDVVIDTVKTMYNEVSACQKKRRNLVIGDCGRACSVIFFR